MLAAEAPMNGTNGTESMHEPVSTQEWERTYGVFLHLSLAAVMAGIPVVVALVMWLLKREKSAFVDDHGKEALNFQISLVLYNLAGIVLMPVCGIGVVLIVAACVLGIVGVIMGAVAASNGRLFRYPACIRLVH